MRDRRRGDRVEIRQADARLRGLLTVEDRLQASVRAVEAEAANRVASVLAAREAYLADARRGAEREDETRREADAAAHEASMAALAHARDTAIAALRDLPDARVDALAHWALQQAIDDGDAP